MLCSGAHSGQESPCGVLGSALLRRSLRYYGQPQGRPHSLFAESRQGEWQRVLEGVSSR